MLMNWMLLSKLIKVPNTLQSHILNIGIGGAVFSFSVIVKFTVLRLPQKCLRTESLWKKEISLVKDENLAGTKGDEGGDK